MSSKYMYSCPADPCRTICICILPRPFLSSHGKPCMLPHLCIQLSAYYHSAAYHASQNTTHELNSDESKIIFEKLFESSGASERRTEYSLNTHGTRTSEKTSANSLQWKSNSTKTRVPRLAVYGKEGISTHASRKKEKTMDIPKTPDQKNKPEEGTVNSDRETRNARENQNQGRVGEALYSDPLYPSK